MTQDEFYEKIPEWISKDKDTWNHITLMAYFCYKYELKNKTRFRLVRWKDEPGKGKESRDFSKLITTFLPENYEDMPSDDKKRIKNAIIIKIYNYINWMFDYKFRSGERSVNGTQLFLTPSIINEFERMYNSYIKKNEIKNNIDTFLEMIKKEYPSIFDNHQIEEISDLKILERYVSSYNLSDDSVESIVINKAKSIGLI